MSKVSSTQKPLRLLAASMGIALLGWLIVRTGTGTVIAHVRAVGWGLALIIALGGVSHLIRAWAWRLTFRSDVRGLSLARTFALRLISEAVGTFGLAGQVVGDTMRVSLLGPAIPIADRISSVALDRGIYFVASAIVSVIGIFASLLLLSLTGAWRVYALLFAATVTVLLVLTVLMFARQWRVLSYGTHAVQRLPWIREWLTNKVSVIESTEETFLGFHSRAPKSFWGAIVLNFGSQMLAIAEVYLVLRFMGVRITSAGAFVIEAFTKLINVVGALNPGNIGTYEGGNLLLARLLGFTAAAGLTLALCRRARTLFWAGVGALCLTGFSRGRERREPESLNGSRSVNQPESPATCVDTSELSRNDAPAVIILVETGKDSGAFIPALVRVGSLPVLLRAVLSAQMLRPTRIVISAPSSVACVVKDELRRTGRLPQSVEWHERAPGTGLSSVMRELVATADRIVLLSGTNTYKPALLQAVSERKAESEALVFRTGTELAGIYLLSQAAALQLTNETTIDTFGDLHGWIRWKCCVTIAETPRDTWQRITSVEDRMAAEHKLDSWLVKPTDGMFACMNRRISIPISRQLIKLPVSPNMVTFLILAVSVGSGIFFSRGGYWNMLLGAFLSVWASILDGCDGEVARLKLQSSDFGCWLDTICDYLYYVIIFVGIALGLKKTSGTNAYLAWGAVLLAGAALSFIVVSMLRRRMAENRPETFLAEWQKQVERRRFNPLLYLGRHCEFIIRRCFFPYALFVFAVLNGIKIAFVATAIGANLVWTIALYSSFVLCGKRRADVRMEPRMEPIAGIQVPS